MGADNLHNSKRMTSISMLPRCLALAVMLVLTACAAHDRPAALSPAAQRSLLEAMGEDSNDVATLDSLREAARRAPDDAALQQRYCLAAERVKLYPEALAALDRAVALGGGEPDRLLAQGRIALEAGDVPAATRAYGRILDADPGNIDALNGLGVTEDLERHHTQAQTHYDAALRLAPRDWRVRSNLALSLLMAGRADDAAAALTGAEQDPAAPRRARHDLALALVAAGKREQAIAVLRVDIPAAEAAALADEFAGFARWLASPEGARPAVH